MKRSIFKSVYVTSGALEWFCINPDTHCMKMASVPVSRDSGEDADLCFSHHLYVLKSTQTSVYMWRCSSVYSNNIIKHLVTFFHFQYFKKI